MNKFLPAIKIVEFAIADFVTIVANEKIAHGIPIQIAGTFTTICIEGLAAASYETKRVSGQDIYTSKMVMRIGEQQVMPWNLETFLANRNIVYRLTDVNNRQWLMGTNEMPFPVSTTKHDNPAEPSGVNITELEITYSNLFPFLEIE